MIVSCNLSFGTGALAKTKWWAKKPSSHDNWTSSRSLAKAWKEALYLCTQRCFSNGDIPCESSGDKACTRAALLHLDKIPSGSFHRWNVPESNRFPGGSWLWRKQSEIQVPPPWHLSVLFFLWSLLLGTIVHVLNFTMRVLPSQWVDLPEIYF